MADVAINRILSEIRERRLSTGGFANRPVGQSRPDSTAWAIMSLRLGGIESRHLYKTMQHLCSCQMGDGRVALAPEHPNVVWPTALAILALQGEPAFSQYQSHAASFLLESTGEHFKRVPDSPAGHDPSIRGWPWIEGTHSWVEPTSLAMIALRVVGYNGNERVEEAAKLLMDRQLSGGGWNYGNTTVFGTELDAMPESTGIALSALSGLVNKREITRSLSILKDSVGALKTPFSLGWAILGLSAWGERTRNANALVDRCIDRQKRYGAYDTPLLGLMVFARKAEGGVIHAFS